MTAFGYTGEDLHVIFCHSPEQKAIAERVVRNLTQARAFERPKQASTGAL